MSKHRVVITGIGLITPVGNSTHETWQGLLDGRSGIKSIPESFNLGDYPIKSAGLITGESHLLEGVLPAKFHAKTDRFTHLALIAGHQAMTDAAFDQTTPVQRDRFGVYLGVGVGGLEGINQTAIQMHIGGPKKVSPFTIPKIISNIAPAWLSMQWNLQGPNISMVNACASSTDAVGLAMRAIRDGYADYMLAGGTESCVMPLTIAGFGNMRALSGWTGDSAQASRPFDSQRTGFVLAEGAAVLVLERADIAHARGAKIYAEMVGYGATSDAHHLTAMHPEGRGAQRAIQMALDDAAIHPHHVGYVNAHGTGTPMNDPLETMVLKQVFGKHIDPATQDHAVVSSTKSMTGHMLGAAGAAEAAFCALALQHQKVPPTINTAQLDAACDLDYVTSGARGVNMDYAISNSFGFGGGNAVVVLKKV